MLKKFIEKIGSHYYDNLPDLEEYNKICKQSASLRSSLTQKQKEMLIELEDLYELYINTIRENDLWVGFCIGKLLYTSENNNEDIENIINNILLNIKKKT